MPYGINTFQRIVDENRPNVVFVLTHFASESRSVTQNPQEKINQLKKATEKHTTVPRPTVVSVAENQVRNHEFPIVNGYFQLPNGSFVPQTFMTKK